PVLSIPGMVRKGVEFTRPVVKSRILIEALALVLPAGEPRSAMNRRVRSPGGAVTKMGELRPLATRVSPVIAAWDTVPLSSIPIEAPAAIVANLHMFLPPFASPLRPCFIADRTGAAIRVPRTG